MNLIDCHTHTQFSMDSEADIISCIERAREIGLTAHAITDHCECNAWFPEEHYTENKPDIDYFNYQKDYYASVETITKLKEKYTDGTKLLCGVELGQITQAVDIAEKVAADERLDFIIGSIHMVRNETDFYFIDYEKMTESEILNLLERYFLEVHELSKLNIADVIGHLTYCLRYMKQRNNICPDISRFDDIIAETFRTLAYNGKGIEINTSGIRQGFGNTFPDLKYVKLFCELGGEILSIGSDAHTAEDIGKNVADAVETAKAAGFDRLCYFKNRKPQFVDID